MQDLAEIQVSDLDNSVICKLVDQQIANIGSNLQTLFTGSRFVENIRYNKQFWGKHVAGSFSLAPPGIFLGRSDTFLAHYGTFNLWL